MKPAACSFNISDAYVLVLTAMGGTENPIRGLDLGVDEYLVKPIVKREFLARVGSMVKRAKPPGEVPLEYRDSVISLDLCQPTMPVAGARPCISGPPNTGCSPIWRSTTTLS